MSKVSRFCVGKSNEGLAETRKERCSFMSSAQILQER